MKSLGRWRRIAIAFTLLGMIAVLFGPLAATSALAQDSGNSQIEQSDGSDQGTADESTNALAPWTPPQTVYIPETGHSIDGVFLDYWRANGGYWSFGNPVT